VSGQHACQQGAALTVHVLLARVRAELRAERRLLAVERAAWRAERDAAPTGRHAAGTRSPSPHRFSVRRVR
jgi:hypothetical protein